MFNKFGFCKWEASFRKVHFTEICPLEEWKNRKCQKIQPRPSKFFNQCCYHCDFCLDLGGIKHIHCPHNMLWPWIIIFMLCKDWPVSPTFQCLKVKHDDFLHVDVDSIVLVTCHDPGSSYSCCVKNDLFPHILMSQGRYKILLKHFIWLLTNC